MRAPLRTISWDEHASRTYHRRATARQSRRAPADRPDEESILRERRDSLSAKQSREELILRAHRIGKCEGLNDRHWTRENFAMKAELDAWLEGWREGQVEFREKRAEIARLREEIGRL